MSSEKGSKTKTTKPAVAAVKNPVLPPALNLESSSFELSDAFSSLAIVDGINPVPSIAPTGSVPISALPLHIALYDLLIDTSRVLPTRVPEYNDVLLSTGITGPSDVEYLPTLTTEYQQLLSCLNGIGRLKLTAAVNSLSTAPMLSPTPASVATSPLPLPQLPPLQFIDPVLQLPPLGDNHRAHRLVELQALLATGASYSLAEISDFLNHGSVTVAYTPPPPVSTPPPLLAMSAAANQGATRLQGNFKIGVITAEFLSRFGNQYDTLVVSSVLLSALRSIPDAHSEQVSDISAADVTSLVQFQNITPQLVHRLVPHVNSPTVVAASSVKDFLPVTTFLVICNIFMPPDTLAQLQRLWDFIKLGNSLRNLPPAQLIKVFLHSMTNIYGTAISTVATAPLPLPPSYFGSLIKAAVDVPTELNDYLQQCYLEVVRLREASTTLELATQRSEIAKLSKIVSTLSSKTVRSTSDKPSSTHNQLVLPCFKWLNKQSCGRDCGFYHAWPSTVSASEKEAFLVRAKASSPSPPLAVPTVPTTPRHTPRSNSRPGSPARVTPVIEPPTPEI